MFQPLREPQPKKCRTDSEGYVNPEQVRFFTSAAAPSPVTTSQQIYRSGEQFPQPSVSQTRRLFQQQPVETKTPMFNSLARGLLYSKLSTDQAKMSNCCDSYAPPVDMANMFIKSSNPCETARNPSRSPSSYNPVQKPFSPQLRFDFPDKNKSSLHYNGSGLSVNPINNVLSSNAGLCDICAEVCEPSDALENQEYRVVHKQCYKMKLDSFYRTKSFEDVVGDSNSSVVSYVSVLI